MLAMAGRHPFFLQLAGRCAEDLCSAPDRIPDLTALHRRFQQEAHDHYQYIWDHSSRKEQQALCSLVGGKRRAAKGVTSLVERGYVEAELLSPYSQGFAQFVERQCADVARRQVKPRRESSFAPVPLGPVSESPTAPKQHLAVVVGVNRYRYQQARDHCLPPLDYAERDADEMAKFLGRIGYDVRLLLGSQATFRAVRKAFGELSRQTTAAIHPESRFVFHFSGHGQVDPHNPEAAYLVLHDTDPSRPIAAGIEMTQLVYGLLPGVRVPNSLVLLDACHAGFAVGVRGKDMTPVAHFENVTQQAFGGLRGRVVMAACAGHAQAREASSLKHGIFTHYVLRHWRDLDGDHPPDSITFGTLIDYVGRMLPKCHPDAALPVYSGVGMGGTLVLRKWPTPPDSSP
ncbi:caspase domain-containing protein [Planctomycetota bacterium]